MQGDNLEENQEEILEAAGVCNESRLFSLQVIRRECVHPFDDADLTLLEAKGIIARAGNEIVFSEPGRCAPEGIIRRRLAEVLVHSIRGRGGRPCSRPLPVTRRSWLGSPRTGPDIRWRVRCRRRIASEPAATLGQATRIDGTSPRLGYRASAMYDGHPIEDLEGMERAGFELEPIRIATKGGPAATVGLRVQANAFANGVLLEAPQIRVELSRRVREAEEETA